MRAGLEPQMGLTGPLDWGASETLGPIVRFPSMCFALPCLACFCPIVLFNSPFAASYPVGSEQLAPTLKVSELIK